MSKSGTPLLLDIASRDSSLTADAKTVNAYGEVLEDERMLLVKRPGVTPQITMPVPATPQMFIGHVNSVVVVMNSTFYVDNDTFALGSSERCDSVGAPFSVTSTSLGTSIVDGGTYTLNDSAMQNFTEVWYDGSGWTPIPPPRYIRWNATGRTMYDFVVESAMNPYTLDGTYQHIPNGSIDLGATLGFTGTAESALFDAALSNVQPTNTALPIAKHLGWTFVGNGNILANYWGEYDVYINEFLSTQAQEWANFTTIQTANKVAIDAVGDFVDDTVAGTTGFPSLALAQAEQAVLEAANPPQDTLLDTMFSGNGTTVGPTLTNDNSASVQLTLTRTLQNGWNIYRRVTRNYSIRSVPNTIYYTRTVGLVQITSPANGNTDYPPAIDSFSAFAVADIDAVSRDVGTYPSTFDINWAAFFGGPTRYYNPVITETGTELTVSYTAKRISDNFVYGSVNAYLSAKTGGQLTYDTSVITAYYVDYADTTSIETTENGSITLVSTMTADQTGL